jgi:cytochrome c553
MIVDIPTADEFKRSAANLLYLAWQMVTDLVAQFEEATNYFEADVDREEYWSKCQIKFGNSLSLIQQSMELALKGRIAAVSPFLLISRDPSRWPAGVERKDIPFSEFQTLDAADLIKVHNTVANPALPGEYQTFFNDLRSDRNKIMHSVPRKTFSTEKIIKGLLIAVEYLFNDRLWGNQCIDMEAEGSAALLGGAEFERNVVMRQFDIALRHLQPAEAKRLLAFNKRNRAYLCPSCHGAANRDGGDDFPKLAQLETKNPICASLKCIVCGETSIVLREHCKLEQCKGNVISDEGLCLTCGRW